MTWTGEGQEVINYLVSFVGSSLPEYLAITQRDSTIERASDYLFRHGAFAFAGNANNVVVIFRQDLSPHQTEIYKTATSNLKAGLDIKNNYKLTPYFGFPSYDISSIEFLERSPELDCERIAKNFNEEISGQDVSNDEA